MNLLEMFWKSLKAIFSPQPMILFVSRRGKYFRVTGPAEFLKSIKGAGGYIVIGDEVRIVGGIFSSGGGSVSSDSINGWNISDMTMEPATDEEVATLKDDE